MAIEVRRATLDAPRLARIQIDAWRSAYAGLVTAERLRAWTSMSTSADGDAC